MATSAGWGDFMVAAAGAAGALAGLVFVALSINLTHILELPTVPGRAGETIILLASALIGALLALVPGQPASRLGIVLMALWLPTWGIPVANQIRELARRQYYRLSRAIVRLFLHHVATVPLLLAGLSLRGYLAGGLNWFAAAVVLSLIVALFNAWILLVEILR